MEDPFDVLGLEPGCTQDDVRRAFRQAASTCHPDSLAARGDPRAAERFRACVAARDALLDPARRAQAEEAHKRRAAPFGGAFDKFFDNVDRNGRGATSGPGPGRPRRGRDVERAVGLSLEQAFRGGSYVLRDAPGPCEPCEGTGTVRAREARPCETCAGTGATRQTRGIITVSVECQSCGGRGKTHAVPCPSCGGQGRCEGDGAPYEVPPGARDGMVNVLRGYGAPGFNGGARGDLRLLYRVRPHAVFTREGDDLAARVRVPVWDAATGCRREIAGIDGEPVVVEVPAGSAGGDRIHFAGRGMPSFPGRGSLHVEILVDVPAADTPALREAYARLQAAAASAGGAPGADGAGAAAAGAAT